MRKLVQLPLFIIIVCLLSADVGFAQVDPAVLKARKKEEKARQKALKKEQLREQAQLKNEENFKSSDVPSKKVKVAKEKKVKQPKEELDYGQPATAKTKTPKPPKQKKQPTTTKTKVKQPKEKKVKQPIYKESATVKTKQPKEKKVKQPKEKTTNQTSKTAQIPKTPKTKAPKEKTVKTKPVTASKSVASKPASTKPEPQTRNKQQKTSNCIYAFNTTDEFTGKAKVATNGQNFFTFTEDDLRKFMDPGKEFLTCNGYISSISGIKALNLEYVFDSPYAKQEYGPIHNGSNLIIKLINGSTVTLLSQEFDPGTVDMGKLRTYYTTAYLIGPKDEKELLKAEVDKVRVIWDVGYEDYEVYELDFFIDQLNCIYAAQ